jgi:hypothetical protein
VWWWRATGLLAFLLLTILTQVGGLVLLLAWGVARTMTPRGWVRAGAVAGGFVVLYAATTAWAIPPLAALGGRVPLPCRAAPDRRFAAAHPIFCVLNRHYVTPRVVTLLARLAHDLDAAQPGTTTLFLDANFPFLTGFPLLPHLSHDDGRKLDLALFYADANGTYRPGETRSPIGYFAFEQPDPSVTPPCPPALLTLRWDLPWLQAAWPAMPLEPVRTRAAVDWLVAHADELAVDRLFLEPHLAQRLGVSSPLVRFQGCRAARHDDHIHVQLKR